MKKGQLVYVKKWSSGDDENAVRLGGHLWIVDQPSEEITQLSDGLWWCTSLADNHMRHLWYEYEVLTTWPDPHEEK